MTSAPDTLGSHRDVPPAFGRIVCGIDGSRSSPVAADQAIALSGTGTALVFVCVREERGAGATHQATLTMDRAQAALERAVQAAREAGVDAAAEILPGHDPMPVLLDEASRSDVLVVAKHGLSPSGPVSSGSRAAWAVHHAHVPVLVARRPPGGVEFLARSWLQATDRPGPAAPSSLPHGSGVRVGPTSTC